MSINLSCRNSNCKYYWEDMCTEHTENKIIFLNENGTCENFVKGKSYWYESEKQYVED